MLKVEDDEAWRSRRGSCRTRMGSGIVQNADGFCGQNADGFCAVFRTRMGSELGGGSREQDCLKVAIRNRQYVRPVITGTMLIRVQTEV